MRFAIIRTVLIVLLSFGAGHASAKPARLIALEKTVYNLNNTFRFNASIAAIHHFLADSAHDNEDRYYCYLFLSYTYKWLNDYRATQAYLDSAIAYGKATPNPDYYIANIICQKSFALFDLQNFRAADSLMNILAGNNYKYLSEDDQTTLIIQQGFLYYKAKKYNRAEERYAVAMDRMKQSTPCELPLIYGKQILLYAATKQQEKLDAKFAQALKSAKDCRIAKYTLYTYEVMADACRMMGDYKQSNYYFGQLYGLERQGNAKTHLETITELDKRYQTKEKEARLMLQAKELQRKNFFITSLFGVIAITVLLALIAFNYRRYLNQRKEEALRLQFTQQLLQNTEHERSRTAGELHDGISHELLTLKNSLAQGIEASADRIDRIINDIRQISRDLHPIMLDKIGLKASIENLCERYMADESLFVTADINYNQELDAPGELQLYRIVQEALTNIEKYAGALAAQIMIGVHGDHMVASIKDNGKGFDVAATLSGRSAFGLHSIIERSRVLGGKAQVISGSRGTTITIEIPLQHA